MKGYKGPGPSASVWLRSARAGPEFPAGSAEAAVATELQVGVSLCPILPFPLDGRDVPRCPS